jgi:UPF0271 protein
MQKKYKKDINCDMGESFGNYKIGNDLQIMDYVSSVNIACGFHAGDPSVIRSTVQNALKKELKVGAHPGFLDLQGFGRRNMNLSKQEIYDICLYQIAALYSISKALGGKLNHVKPHGALYNMACNSVEITEAIVNAILAIDKDLVFYALSGSLMASKAKEMGLKVYEEVFADRAYLANGMLSPRSNPDAVLKSKESISEQIHGLMLNSEIKSIERTILKCSFDTICIHGDEPTAFETAKVVSEIVLTY